MNKLLIMCCLLLAYSVSVIGATNCTVTSVPALVRVGGRAEMVGQITAACTGGDGPASPVDFDVTFSEKVTSRVLNSLVPEHLETLLLVDEPQPSPGTPAQVPCTATTAAAGCPTSSNVFQAELANQYKLVFRNVSFEPPGAGIRILRITNIRLDAGDISSGVPVPLTAQLSASDSSISFTNNPVNVAFAVNPLSVSLRTGDNSDSLEPNGLELSQCVSTNRELALDPASSIASDGVSFIVRITEGYAGALKKIGSYSSLPLDVNTRPDPETQANPATISTTESGFYNPSFPSDEDHLNLAGLASQATRILVRFQSPANGLRIYAPIYELGKGILDSRVRLVDSYSDGSYPTYSPLAPSSTALNTFYAPSQVYVYEITARGDVDPSIIEQIDLPFYAAHTGQPYTATGDTTVRVGLAPFSDGLDPTSAVLPRFVDSATPVQVARLEACAAQAKLKATVTGKSGTASARTWSVTLANSGAGAAVNARITGLTLTQTSGAACTPVVLSSFPVTVGGIPASSSASTPVVVSFSGCPAAARFKVEISYAEDGGVSGTDVYYNQFR